MADRNLPQPRMTINNAMLDNMTLEEVCQFLYDSSDPIINRLLAGIDQLKGNYQNLKNEVDFFLKSENLTKKES